MLVYLRYSYLILFVLLFLYKRVCAFCKIVCIRNSACNDNFFNPLQANLISSSPLGFDHCYTCSKCDSVHVHVHTLRNPLEVNQYMYNRSRVRPKGKGPVRGCPETYYIAVDNDGH